MKIKNKTAGHAGIACFSFALKGNRAGSPHFKIVRFKWWEHVTSYLKVNNDILNEISITRNLISKEKYAQFEKTIHRLYEFLHIFKSDLQAIEIDRKENQDCFVCDLVMVYDSYKIHAEYESTGIKKLVRLFAYLNEMVRGGIVFIDEFDSNLHDVYLCALLKKLLRKAI